jgi:hypothetical protein
MERVSIRLRFIRESVLHVVGNAISLSIITKQIEPQLLMTKN